MMNTTMRGDSADYVENNLNESIIDDKDVEIKSSFSNVDSRHDENEVEDFTVDGHKTSNRSNNYNGNLSCEARIGGMPSFCDNKSQSAAQPTRPSTPYDRGSRPSFEVSAQEGEGMEDKRHHSLTNNMFREPAWSRKRPRIHSNTTKAFFPPVHLDYPDTDDSGTEHILKKYRELGYHLLSKMIKNERNRTRALLDGNPVMRNSKKSNDGWMASIFVWKERSLKVIAIPWTICVANAVLWQILESTMQLSERPYMAQFKDGSPWEAVHSMVFSTTLAFLLVFRLNRVALRWWETRRMWGVIVEQIRLLVSSALEHLRHAQQKRDEAIAWSCAFAVASKQLLRNETIVRDELAGILTEKDLSNLQQAQHFPLYAASRLRRAVCEGLAISEDTPLSIATSHTAVRQSLEGNIDNLVANVGGMERVKATPLPLVYVSHLRTFLLLYLLSLPYLYGPSWQYWTIPFVALLSFALLGIDGAAAECEAPFDKHRPNHLDMEMYCIGAFSNVTELMMIQAQAQLHEYGGIDHDVEIEV